MESSGGEISVSEDVMGCYRDDADGRFSLQIVWQRIRGPFVFQLHKGKRLRLLPVPWGRSPAWLCCVGFATRSWLPHVPRAL